MKGNNIAMYIEEQQTQRRENKPILVAAPNEHTQKKGGKNIYSLLVAALNEHTQKKKKKGGGKNKPI